MTANDARWLPAIIFPLAGLLALIRMPQRTDRGRLAAAAAEEGAMMSGWCSIHDNWREENMVCSTCHDRRDAVADEALALLKRDEVLLGIAERDYYETGEGDRGIDCGLAAADIRALLDRAERSASRPKPGDLCGIHATYTPGCAVCDSPLTADREAGA